MYTENYETLLKEIKEDLNKWKDIYIHQSRLNIVNMAILPKLCDRFNIIPFKIPVAFCRN